MSRDILTINDSWPLRDASRWLEANDRTGAPVVDADGRLCGYLSLRDVVKARRAECMESQVRAYMGRAAVAGSPSMSLREIESLFSTHTIYDLPVVRDGRIVGVVTHDGYLRARAGE